MEIEEIEKLVAEFLRKLEATPQKVAKAQRKRGERCQRKGIKGIG